MKSMQRKIAARPTASADRSGATRDPARDEARTYGTPPGPVNAREGLFTGGATLH
ncbi:hypothetical protein ACETK8_18625 [Brevundimonas staleyi]|uniref:Uncharacterized protein n=1 Tax=Brevundimonas staleyi TaxID=74326 RepID=A0ABW0FR00_9CAUL